MTNPRAQPQTSLVHISAIIKNYASILAADTKILSFGHVPGRPGAEYSGKQADMTGIIIGLVSSTRSGTIGTPDGSRVVFSAEEVLGDFESLAVGQRVNFDFDRRYAPARAARVMHEPTGQTANRKPGGALDLRYAGFEQSLNVRTYRFRCASDGPPTREFVVSVDMALLLEHHVNVQEAPALCMRRLAADLANTPGANSHCLDRDDLLAYVASRSDGDRKGRSKAGRKGSHRPAEALTAGRQPEP